MAVELIVYANPMQTGLFSNGITPVGIHNPYIPRFKSYFTVKPMSENEKKLDVPQEEDPFEMKVRELSQLSKEQLVERLAQYELALDQMNFEVRYWLQNMFSQVRIVKRNYTPIFGTLIGLVMEPKLYIVYAYEEEVQYDKDHDIAERKIVRIPAGSTVYVETIQERKEIPKKTPSYGYGNV